MRKIEASVAKTEFSAPLDEVERGETLVITRHGKPIARLVPEQNRRQQEIDAAIARIESRRKAGPHVATEEILE